MRVKVGRVGVVVVVVKLVCCVLPRLLGSTAFTSGSRDLILKKGAAALDRISVLGVSSGGKGVRCRLLMKLDVLKVVFVVVDGSLVVLCLNLRLCGFSACVLVFCERPSGPEVSVVCLVLSSVDDTLLMVSFLLLCGGCKALGCRSLVGLVPGDVRCFGSVLLLVAVSVVFGLKTVPFFF